MDNLEFTVENTTYRHAAMTDRASKLILFLSVRMKTLTMQPLKRSSMAWRVTHYGLPGKVRLDMNQAQQSFRRTRP